MSGAAIDRLVDDLVEVLQTQRQAMGRLDVEALVDCNARSQQLLGDLGAALGAAQAPSPAVRQKVTRVSIEAEATALLVKDALEVIRGLMGADSAPGVYDARGAMHAGDRRLVARSV